MDFARYFCLTFWLNIHPWKIIQGCFWAFNDIGYFLIIQNLIFSEIKDFAKYLFWTLCAKYSPLLAYFHTFRLEEAVLGLLDVISGLLEAVIEIKFKAV